MANENPIDLLADWPTLGSGNHSDATRKHHDWVKQLSTTVKELRNKGIRAIECRAKNSVAN